MDKKIFVLVAGCDYNAIATGKGGLDFHKACLSRVVAIVKTRDRGEHLKFYLFDVGRRLTDAQEQPLTLGVIERVPNGRLSPLKDGRGDPDITLDWKQWWKNWEAPAQADYQVFRTPHGRVAGKFKRRKNQILSILNVYQAIRAMPKDSVYELSFFSHGFWGGPILINSNEGRLYLSGGPWTPTQPEREDSTNDGASPALRDPADADARYKKDFKPNMGERDGNGNELTIFKSKFANGADIRFYGCSFNQMVKDLISQSWDLPRRGVANTDPKGPQQEALVRALTKAKFGNLLVRPDKQFTIVIGSKTLDDYREIAFKDPFWGSDPGIGKSLRLSKSFEEVVVWITGRLLISYAFVAAETLSGAEPKDKLVSVYAAPYGTGSNVIERSSKPTRSRATTMELQEGHGVVVSFHAQIFGMERNNDNYLLHDKRLVDLLSDEIQAKPQKNAQPPQQGGVKLPLEDDELDDPGLLPSEP